MWPFRAPIEEHHLAPTNRGRVGTSIQKTVLARSGGTKLAVLLFCFLTCALPAMAQESCDASEFQRQYEIYRSEVLPEWRKNGWKSRWWYFQEPNLGKDTRVLIAEEKPLRIELPVVECAAEAGDPVAAYLLVMDRVHAPEVAGSFITADVRIISDIRTALGQVIDLSKGSRFACEFYGYDCSVGLPEAWYAAALAAACMGDVQSSRRAFQVAATAKVRRARMDVKTVDQFLGLRNCHLIGRAPSAIIEKYSSR